MQKTATDVASAASCIHTVLFVLVLSTINELMSLSIRLNFLMLVNLFCSEELVNI